MMRWFAPLVAALTCGCVTLTSEGAHVVVYRAPLDAPQALRSMPEGCRLLSSAPPESMTELDLEGQKEPFRARQNEAGARGGNALLVLTRMTMPRHDSDCPVASPITDCPPSFGAWYRVEVESYACPTDALDTLAKAQPRTNTTNIEPFHP